MLSKFNFFQATDVLNKTRSQGQVAAQQKKTR